jgi:hypothetical protein
LPEAILENSKIPKETATKTRIKKGILPDIERKSRSGMPTIATTTLISRFFCSGLAKEVI